MADQPEQGRLAIEERERQIQSVGQARRVGRVPARRPEAPSLRADFEVERFVSPDELRELARRAYERPVISVYLNATAEKTVRRPPVLLTVFNSMRHGEESARAAFIGALPTQQRRGLAADLDEIGDLLGTLDVAGSRSVVVFKSGRELNRVILLPLRTADSLTIDADPYIQPLEAALEAHPQCLVVEVSKEESRFWIQLLGQLTQVESAESFVPTDKVDRSRPGKVQRHRLTHLEWHLKTTAHVAARLVVERGLDLVILSGDERVVANLDRFLPDSVRAMIAGRLHPSPHAGRDEWQRQIEQVLVEHRRRKEEEALGRLGEYEARGRLVGGLAGVIEVANRFIVRRLFVSAGLTEPGAACRQHHFLSLQAGHCPFCGAELFPTGNVVDELVEFARLHGVELMLIEERTDLLEPYAGVAAVTYELV